MEARADQEGLKGGATSIPRALLGAVAVIGTYYVFVT